MKGRFCLSVAALLVGMFSRSLLAAAPSEGGDYDVIVAGGGPAGIGAGYMAAARGAKTLVLEKSGRLGGMAVQGMVSPFSFSVESPVVRRLAARLAMGRTVDLARADVLAYEALTEVGADVLLHADVIGPVMDGARVVGLEVNLAEGRRVFRAKAVVDATGDGIVAAAAGVPFKQGREGDGLVQPMSVMFTVGGIAPGRRLIAVSEEQARERKIGEKTWEAIVAEEIAAGNLPPEVSVIRLYWAPDETMTVVNATQICGLDGAKSADRTRAEIVCRKQAFQVLDVLRRRVPGYERARIVEMPAVVGVRETRRFEGVDRLTTEDVLTGRKRADAIARNCSFVIDIHNPAGGGQAHGRGDSATGGARRVKPYDIPYGALVPKTVEGLLFCGRCLSASHEALASCRVMGNAMATGVGAGAAAAYAVRHGLALRDVPAERLDLFGATPEVSGVERADVVQPVPFSAAFSAEAAKGVTRQVGRFAVPAETDLRPWRVRYSFRYRTRGFAGEGLRLVTQVAFDGGRRVVELTPVARNLNWDAGTTYRCGASEDWKEVDLDVDFRNALPPEVRVVCAGLAATGQVEFADFTAALVLKPRHRLTGGEFPLAEGNVLKHVFFADEGCVRVALADPTNLVRAVAVVRDAEGQVQDVRTLAATDEIRLAGRGFYALEVAASYADGTKVTTTGSAAVLGPALSAAQTAESRFGVMVVNGGAGAFTRALGSRWDWRFFFHGKDNAAFVGPQFGEGVIYAGHQSPIYPEAMDPAHVGKGGMWPAKDWAKQRALTRAFLEKNPCFAGRRLCLVNEPDFKWRGTIPEMVQAHRIFAEEVHRLYPDCEVQGPACSRVKPDYLRALGKEGFFDCVDAINIHAYVDGTKPEGEFRLKLREGMDVIRREFACAKPVYITEFGWTTVNGTWQEPVSELTQARYLTRACAFVASEDIRAAVWFCDLYVARNYGEGGFSILRLGNDCVSPKPAVAAFATLARNLGDVRGRLRAVPVDATTWVASGRKADGSAVTLVWTRTGAREMPLPVRATRAEDFLGRAVKLGETLRVSESPVYLFGDETHEGPAWVAPPTVEKPVVVAADEFPLGRTGTGWKCRDNLQTPVLPDACWSGADAPKPNVRVAYSDEGLVFNVDVPDAKHEQPFAQERLMEGDAVTVAVDVDRGTDWQPNAHITSYKGHRCFEYTVALRDDGKREAWRRNAWDFDIKPNQPVVVFNNVTRVGADRTRYMIWLTWPRLGLDGPPPPGTKFGIAVSVSDRTDGKLTRADLFGGISGTPNPMKYGTFVCK